MGTGSSFVRDASPTSSIGDEIPNGHVIEVNGKVKRIPNEICARRYPPTSVRSMGSFSKVRRRGHSTHSMNGGADVDKKFFRELEASRGKEIDGLKGQIERLKNENNRLRTELKMQKVACSKLIEERDSYMRAEERAFQRAALIEKDKDKMQNMFKMYRESKEKEVQDLLRAKRELEGKLQKMGNLGEDLPPASPQQENTSDLFSNGGQPGEWWSAQFDGSELGIQPVLEAGRGPEFAQALLEVNGPFTNVSKVDWSVAALSVAQSQLSWEIQSLLSVYISATPDMHEEAEAFCELAQQLSSVCEADNRHFYCCYLPFEMTKAASGHVEKYRSIVRRELEKSDIFVAFLGSLNTKFTKDEIEMGYLNNPGLKPTLVCVKEPEPVVQPKSKQKGAVPGKSLIESLKRKIIASGKAKVLEAGSSVQKTVKTFFDEFKRSFKMELSGYEETDRILSEYCDDPDIPPSVFQDRHDEAEQTAVLSQAISTEGTFGLEKYFEHLDEHVSGSGPLPPLLVLGDVGSGKTHLLAKWVERLKEKSPGILILTHFVGSFRSSSTDPILMMRRLTALMMQTSGVSLPLSCDPSRIEAEFPRWLDKCSRRQGGVILVLDSIDKFENGEQHLNWLLDPLPVEARIVVSSNEKTCPDMWRLWPNLSMYPLSIKDGRALLRQCLGNTKNLVTSEQETKLVSCGKGSQRPLHIVLVAKHLASDNTAATLATRIDACLKCAKVHEVIGLILSKIEAEFEPERDYVKKILSLIACSQNGFAASEILKIVPVPLIVWSPLYFALLDRHIVKDVAGLVTTTSDEVKQAISSKYLKSTETRMQTFHSACDLFEKRMTEGSVTNRVADELPRLLQDAERKERLQEVVTHPVIFLRLYRRGRSSHLVRCWHYIGGDQSQMAQQYCDAVKRLQDESHGDVEELTKVACLYENVGRFLKDLGLMSQAVNPLQRSLDVREQALDPDHPSVAESLYHLGNLYTQWGKFASAEELYQQAMEIIELAHGPESLQMAKHLEALAILYKKQDRNETADPLHRRALAIQHHYLTQPPSKQGNLALKERIHRRALQLEELALGPDSASLARSLNELAVFYYLQDNHEAAEKIFIRALEMRDSIHSKGHPDIAQSLNNLASLYNNRGRLNEAAPLYERALAIRLKAFPPEHPCVATTVNQLAVLYRKQNEFGKAEPLYKQALEIREKSFGESHPSVATALNNLAVLYCKTRNYSAAEPLYQRALRIYDESLGSTHPRVAETLRNLAVLHFDKGDLESAASLYKRCTDLKDFDLTMTKPIISVSRAPSEYGKSDWAGDTRSLEAV
eukprot:m.34072 g.34072  ORF g.34072 m.34072 type:complete len:1310 (+) comp31945_c0_seq3:122-4051(+)